jgi:hypothetical protein
MSIFSPKMSKSGPPRTMCNQTGKVRLGSVWPRGSAYTRSRTRCVNAVIDHRFAYPKSNSRLIDRPSFAGNSECRWFCYEQASG